MEIDKTYVVNHVSTSSKNSSFEAPKSLLEGKRHTHALGEKILPACYNERLERFHCRTLNPFHYMESKTYLYMSTLISGGNPKDWCAFS